MAAAGQGRRPSLPSQQLQHPCACSGVSGGGRHLPCCWATGHSHGPACVFPQAAAVTRRARVRTAPPTKAVLTVLCDSSRLWAEPDLPFWALGPRAQASSRAGCVFTSHQAQRWPSRGPAQRPSAVLHPGPTHERRVGSGPISKLWVTRQGLLGSWLILEVSAQQANPRKGLGSRPPLSRCHHFEVPPWPSLGHCAGQGWPWAENAAAFS